MGRLSSGDRPTVKDVAAVAGVSATTVSRVLAGNYPVAATTRGRVMRAVEQLDYVANAQARALVGGGPRTVAFIIRDLVGPLFAEHGQVLGEDDTEHRNGERQRTIRAGGAGGGRGGTDVGGSAVASERRRGHRGRPDEHDRGDDVEEEQHVALGEHLRSISASFQSDCKSSWWMVWKSHDRWRRRGRRSGCRYR